MPKVSVVMGVYNCKDEEALFKSVKSIIEQKYCDWEFIIINDGSNDDTSKLLDKVKKLDDRIVVVSYTPNKGLAFALNYGISLAKGEYIARMDDDDISREDRLEKQIRYLEEHPEIDFIGSIANVFNKEGIWGSLKMPQFPTKNDFLWNIPFIHPSMVFRKKLFESCQYNTDKINLRCEDYTLVMELYSLGFRGYNFQEPLINYFVDNGSKKYRPMKDRITETIVRYRGYKKNGILLKGIPFILKPVILGLVPQIIFKRIKEIQYSRSK